MKKCIRILLCVLILAFVFQLQVFARAGGGGGSGGGGGGGGTTSGDSHYYGRSRYGRANPLSILLNIGIIAIIVSGGTIVFVYKAKKAKAKSVRLMKQYESLGINWDYKEIQRRVETAYYVIQECWRRQDTQYASEYLSRELIENWNAKLEWMKLRDEEVIQRNVRLLSAQPVCVIDEEGTENDRIWYLIHGRMTGYYINKYTRLLVRGNQKPESFYEYWLFIYEEGRWVLHEIRQKDEIDINQFSEQ